MPFLIRRRAALAPGSWLAMFSLHGLVSYATAYLCFFASLAQLGLARTVAVTAAWPLVSLFTASLERRTVGARTVTPPYFVVASCVLLVGATVEIWLGG